MKKNAALILLTITLAGSALADTPISLGELPESAMKSIQDYFPASKAISAEKDTDDGKIKYKVIVQYKEITIEVEVLPTGKIVDLDM